ncbi:hypothetical protein CJ469_01011 [Nocardia farcinica]|nr:hypothetical protein CJ469_01011 [Nocardia farcinica]PFX10863.1 hypothetical protein CJ468_00537 [Nocardia farcinica]
MSSVARTLFRAYPEHMATVHHPTVDLAGSAWPVYKLEALAAALVTALLLGVLTGSAKVAVLAAAVAAAVRVGFASTAARRLTDRRAVRHPSLQG